RRDQLAPALSADGGVDVVAVALPVRDLERAPGHWNQMLARLVAVRVDDERVATSEPVARGCRLGDERLVELVEELVLRDEPDCDGRTRDGHRDRDRGEDDQPLTEAHGSSRSAYPTPRTVCSRRGSPPSSSLRRRYPMYTQSAFEVAPKS